jgi:hypothetical protein
VVGGSDGDPISGHALGSFAWAGARTPRRWPSGSSAIKVLPKSIIVGCCAIVRPRRPIGEYGVDVALADGHREFGAASASADCGRLDIAARPQAEHQSAIEGEQNERRRRLGRFAAEVIAIEDGARREVVDVKYQKVGSGMMSSGFRPNRRISRPPVRFRQQ